MLKVDLRAWIIGLALLAAVGWIVGDSQTFNSCIQEYKAHHANQNLQESVPRFLTAARPYRECLGAFIHENSEAVIAALTIVLALSTFFLWGATRDLVRGSKKVAQTQLRAFVFAKGCEQAIHLVDIPGGQRIKDFIFFAKIENIGLTPATDVRLWIKHQTLPMLENREPHFEWTGSGATTVLGPQGGGQTQYCFIPVETMIELWENKTEVYIATRIEYRDIFDPSVVHHHEQCAQLGLLYHPTEIRPKDQPPAATMLIYGPQNTVA